MQRKWSIAGKGGEAMEKTGSGMGLSLNVQRRAFSEDHLGCWCSMKNCGNASPRLDFDRDSSDFFGILRDS